MILDALNLYFRQYIVNPSLSTVSGQPIGGLQGFLASLQTLTREVKPDLIVVCWDGPGGSKKRKTLVKDYKGGRKPIRLNRNIRNMSENEEIENKVWQQTRLVEYLNTIPVIQLMLESVEADDIISYVVQHYSLDGWQKVIVSSDKDFYQLCDNETVVLRPIQDQVKSKVSIIEEFGIHPTNFALARAIAGDKSDNLPGVGGVGLPTISKRLPFLAEEKSYTIDEVYEYCDEMDSKIKAYENIVEQVDKIKSNYDVMQLYSPLISIQGKNKIEYALKEFEYHFNKTEVRKMMIQDGFGKWNWSDLFQTLNKIALVKRQGQSW
jgi:DNA polymerase-1